MISAELLITMQQIQIYAQKQKGKLLTGGQALPEQAEPDEPILSDVDYQTSDKTYFEDPNGLDRILPLPKTPVPAVVVTPAAAPSSASKTLAERIAEKKQNPQINIEEAIASASEEKPVQAVLAAESNQTVSEPNNKRWRNRLTEYYEARVAWRIERYRRQYEDGRLKQRLLDQCVGYDDIIAFIDMIIKDDRKRDASKLPTDDANNI